jgi:hypothetical protein
MAIPPSQMLHNTVQGNWGFSTDPNNEGVTTGVYRDGYSADGAIFKGKSGKRYKRMLEQGPYTIKYEFRKGDIGHDVKIYVNEKLIHNLQNEGVSSDKLGVLGTNYANYNDLPKEATGRGRRNIDYIKFIPKQKHTLESFTSTRSSKTQEYWENKMKIYFNNIKNATTENASPKHIEAYTKELFENKWKGLDYSATEQFYLMHKEIAAGIPASEVINSFKNLLSNTDDPYFNKKMDDETAKSIGTKIGYEKPEEFSAMMEKSIAKIKSITFVIEPINIGERQENTFKKASEKVPHKIEPRYMEKNNKANGFPQTEVINASQGKDLFCPKNCVKPSFIDGNCDKDIIRMVVGGEDKFYRKCNYRCKNRFEKDFVNYDKSGPGNPYNVKRDGCRYTQAHCVSNCNKVLVEVDEQGRDLNALANNYTRTSETEKYAKSRLFATKATTGLFGANDNRLGGSKTAYKTDYKPQDPNPKQGPVNYDAIWDFNIK